MPRSLAARMSLPTQRDPCRLPAWLGRTINTVCSACATPLRASTMSYRDRQVAFPDSCTIALRCGSRKTSSQAKILSDISYFQATENIGKSNSQGVARKLTAACVRGRLDHGWERKTFSALNTLGDARDGVGAPPPLQRHTFSAFWL